MRTTYFQLLALIGVAVLGGCAHAIEISPDLDTLAVDDTQPRIEKHVGYYISDENRALMVTTPGGGGDRVKYRPYAELEAGLEKVLASVFARVSVVNDAQDREFLKSKGISYVFTPTIATTSSSRNGFFWPPTDFSVTIDCFASDDQSRPIWQSTVQADGGLLPVQQILKDYGLAGRRAAQHVLEKLRAELEAAPAFR